MNHSGVDLSGFNKAFDACLAGSRVSCGSATSPRPQTPSFTAHPTKRQPLTNPKRHPKGNSKYNNLENYLRRAASLQTCPYCGSLIPKQRLKHHIKIRHKPKVTSKQKKAKFKISHGPISGADAITGAPMKTMMTNKPAHNPTRRKGARGASATDMRIINPPPTNSFGESYGETDT